MNIATHLFADSALKVVRLAEQLAIEHAHYTYSPAHLMWCVVGPRLWPWQRPRRSIIRCLSDSEMG